MANANPLISVIVPAYNCAAYISEALDSLLAQTCQNFEAIVVDDGSTDTTRTIVDSYVQRYPDKIRYFYQNNAGLVAARNTAIRNARGEFLALLDADDVWLPERLEEGTAVLKKNPEVGLVHSNAMVISEKGVPARLLTANKHVPSGEVFEPFFLREMDILCLTVMFRKECCDRVGVFDEKLNRIGCEDRDLWLRIAQHFKIQYIDKVLARYRVRGTSMSRNRTKMLQARLYVVDKFLPEGKTHQRLRRLAISRIYKEMGDEFLLERNFKEARRYYVRTLSAWPFSPWALVNFLKALLKVRVADFRTEIALNK